MEVCLADDVALRARRAPVTFWSVAVGHPLLLPEPAAESQSSDEQVLLARAVHSRLFPGAPALPRLCCPPAEEQAGRDAPRHP